MNSKMVKILGLVATAVSLGATLLGDWVKDKQMDDRIEEKVVEVLARQKAEES